MTLDEYLDKIAASEKDDWSVIDRPIFIQDHQQVSSGNTRWIEVKEHYALLSFRSDLSISIATGYTDNDDFVEPWANSFPHKKASTQFVDFLFNGTVVLRDLRVIVDGGRAGLPLPSMPSKSAPQRKVQIWDLIDQLVGGDRFAEYFNDAGLRIDSTKKWP